MTDDLVKKAVICFVRENFVNDGAEGEAVHLLCKWVETAEKRIAELEEERQDWLTWCSEVRKTYPAAFAAESRANPRFGPKPGEEEVFSIEAFRVDVEELIHEHLRERKV